MTRDEFQDLMRATFDELLALYATKGRDYAGDQDALSNFKRQAERLDLTPEQIWAVYCTKHWDAVMAYCARGRVESEPIESRIDDALLYLFLLRGLVKEAAR